MSKQPTLSISCSHCRNEFRAWPSRLKYGRGRHCSPGCQYAARRAAPKRSIEFSCIGCGKSFARPPSWTARKGAGKYCTRTCRDKHWVGDQTPNWQNGNGVYKRGPRWYSIRRAILARDKVCRHCGADGKLHVHHKTPFRMFDNQDAANDHGNLIALCPPCHRKEDSRSKWVGLEGGIIIRMDAGGAAWQLAREKGMV